MSSSRPNSAAQPRRPLIENPGRIITGIQQPNLFSNNDQPMPGSMSDATLVRSLIAEVIRKSSKSRAQIAEEMSYLVGREITERMLNGFTADSRDDYRWPGELDRAFCFVTGDDRLLRCRVELSGYVVITNDEFELLELGRQYLIRQRAANKVELLERRLQGVEL
jgi:hypothetical protein